jgi:hypothetical protein
LGELLGKTRILASHNHLKVSFFSIEAEVLNQFGTIAEEMVTGIVGKKNADDLANFLMSPILVGFQNTGLSDQIRSD